MSAAAGKHVLGVIGYPIGHSFSPLLHAFFIERLGLDAAYHAFAVQPEALPQAIAGARALGIRGLNVTTPHKQAVLPLLDAVDETARQIGAVNTIFFDDDGAAGTNTDAPGLLASLRHAEVALRGRAVVVLGAGGAARAVVYAAKASGAGEVLIYNRTAARARELARVFDAREVALEAVTELPAGSIVVNATSVGMAPQEDASPLPAALMRGDLVYVDLVYNPLQTRFLQQAANAGARTVDGLGMLIFQGAIALGGWMGVTVPVAEMHGEVKALLLAKMQG